MVPTSEFLWQQIHFPAEYGVYCLQSHWFLFWTPLKTRVATEVATEAVLRNCKKGVPRKFANFTEKQLC